MQICVAEFCGIMLNKTEDLASALSRTKHLQIGYQAKYACSKVADERLIQLSKLFKFHVVLTNEF